MLRDGERAASAPTASADERTAGSWGDAPAGAPVPRVAVDGRTDDGTDRSVASRGGVTAGASLRGAADAPCAADGCAALAGPPELRGGGSAAGRGAPAVRAAPGRDRSAGVAGAFDRTSPAGVVAIAG
jgi:hypothetical protein